MNSILKIKDWKNTFLGKKVIIHSDFVFTLPVNDKNISYSFMNQKHTGIIVGFCEDSIGEYFAVSIPGLPFKILDNKYFLNNKDVIWLNSNSSNQSGLWLCKYHFEIEKNA